jgi:hypothetical protein
VRSAGLWPAILRCDGTEEKSRRDAGATKTVRRSRMSTETYNFKVELQPEARGPYMVGDNLLVAIHLVLDGNNEKTRRIRLLPSFCL